MTPLGAFLRMLPRRVEAEIVLLEVELNRSKPDCNPRIKFSVPGFRIGESQSLDPVGIGTA